MNASRWIGWCLLCGANLLPADDASTRFTRAIETAPRTQTELISVRLDSDVYQHAGPTLADLRVLDGNGREVGYIVRAVPATETTLVRRTGTLSATQLSLRPLNDGGLEITLTLDDDDPPPDGLRLVTPLDNFEQRVHVFASGDGTTWEPLADSLLFDYSRYMDVRSDSLKLPRTPHKQLRILVEQVTASQESELLELTRQLQGENETERVERVHIERRPFRIDRVEFWTEQAEQRTATTLTTDYPLTGFRVAEDAAAHETHVVIETRSQPLEAFQLTTPDRNFSRRARIEVETQVGAGKRWQPLAEGQLTRLAFRSLSREELALTFPQTQARTYRIVIENRDSPPLTVKAVTASGPVREVLFLASPQETFALEYGGDLPVPHYDTAAIEAALSETTTTVAGQLAEQAESFAVPPPSWFNDPWLLTGIIVILVAALGWGLYQAGRRVDQLPGNTSPY
jgi:hypothetical protein